jgi:hypothetical protein
MVYKQSLLVLVLTLGLVASVGCSGLPFFGANYTARTGFYYSNDKGHSYGNGTKEYTTGETVYMKVICEVTSDKDETSQVTATLSIPNSEAINATYMDGQVITPVSDAANNVTTYEFTINASKEPTQVECVIQFKPTIAGTVSMTLAYDDKVDAAYDVHNALEFVKPTNAPDDTH